MPPKTRNGGSRQSGTAIPGGQPVAKNPRKQRRCSEEDESERLSVAMTMAALADSFSESHSSLGNVEPSCLNGNVSSRNDFKLCSDSRISISDSKHETTSASTMKIGLHSIHKKLETPEDGGECFKDESLRILPNDATNHDSPCNVLPVHLTTNDDTLLSNSDERTTISDWEIVSTETDNGGLTQANKVHTARSETLNQNSISSQELASTVSREHMLIDSGTSKPFIVSPQSNDPLGVTFVFTPVMMPNGSSVLMRIAENQIAFMPSRLTCQPSNITVTDQMSCTQQPLHSMFNGDTARKLPISSLDSKPSDGITEPHVPNNHQPLGSLESLQKYYLIEQSKGGQNLVSTSPRTHTTTLSNVNRNDDKCLTTDYVIEDESKETRDPTNKAINFLGSLKSLREFYSSIQKKENGFKDAICSASSRKMLTNVTDGISSVSMLNPAVIKRTDSFSLPNPATENRTDFIIEGVSVSADPFKLVGSSTCRILPEPRPISQLLSYSNPASVSLDVTQCSSPSVEVEIDGSTMLSPTIHSSSGIALKKRPATEDGFLSPSKKTQKPGKSSKRQDPDSNGQEQFTANGSPLSADVETGSDLVFLKNEMCSKDVNAAALEQLDSTASLKMDTQISHLLQWQNGSIRSESNHAVLCRDEDGDLPLHVAVVLEDAGLVEHLLTAMVRLSSSIDCYNNLRQTPLHLAVVSNHLTIVKLLLEFGASPNCPDQKGFNSLHLAVSYGKTECLHALLQHSKVTIDINAMNYEGLTPLHLAVKLNRSEYIDVLVNSGANVNAVDGTSGHSPLYIAAQMNRLSIAASLLQHGASVQLGSYYGCTPIQAASARAHHAIVKLLLQNGAVETSVSEKVKQDSNEPGHRRFKQKISRHLSVASEISTKPELAVCYSV